MIFVCLCVVVKGGGGREAGVVRRDSQSGRFTPHHQLVKSFRITSWCTVSLCRAIETKYTPFHGRARQLGLRDEQFSGGLVGAAEGNSQETWRHTDVWIGPVGGKKTQWGANVARPGRNRSTRVTARRDGRFTGKQKETISGGGGSGKGVRAEGCIWTVTSDGGGKLNKS